MTTRETAAQRRSRERNEAAARLRHAFATAKTLTVHTVLRHVSRSGMMRVIDPLLITPQGEVLHPRWIDVGTVLDRKVDHDRGGIVCHGTGMDMGFELVYSLSRALWPDGYTCDGQGCDSNDHVNARPYRAPNGTDFHRDGGYRLHQRWL